MSDIRSAGCLKQTLSSEWFENKQDKQTNTQLRSPLPTKCLTFDQPDADETLSSDLYRVEIMFVRPHTGIGLSGSIFTLLRNPPPKRLLCFKPHFVGSNGVGYGLFGSKGCKTPQKGRIKMMRRKQPQSAKSGTITCCTMCGLHYFTFTFGNTSKYFVKHVLALQNKFGTQKNTWSIYKSFGNWEGHPPPYMGKIPK